MNTITELETLKAKLKATWTAGDFDKNLCSFALTACGLLPSEVYTPEKS